MVSLQCQENKQSHRRSHSCGGFSYAQKGVDYMGYRKVGCLEQLWYVLKYKLGRLFRRR